MNEVSKIDERVRIEMRFKNATLFEGLLIRFPRKKNLHYGVLNLKQASKKLRVPYSTLCSLLTMRRSPWMMDGELIYSAERLSFKLEIPGEQLFPKRLYSGIVPRIVIRTLDASREITMLEARQQKLLPSYSDDISERYDLRKAIQRIVGTLPPRQRHIIEMRFGLDGEGAATLEEIAADQNVSRERIRHIETKALRTLRHASRARHLRPFLQRGYCVGVRKQTEIPVYFDEIDKYKVLSPLLICSGSCGGSTPHRFLAWTGCKLTPYRVHVKRRSGHALAAVLVGRGGMFPRRRRRGDCREANRKSNPLRWSVLTIFWEI